MKVNSRGQVLLLVLLLISVILVVAMSVVLKATSDIQVSTQEEESVRALNAAESGLEEVLTQANIGSISSDVVIAEKESSYETTIADFGVETMFEYPKSLESGDTATIWLIAHNDSGNLAENGSYVGESLDICWGKPLPSNLQPSQNALYPAIEAIVIYEDALGEILTATAGFDANKNRSEINHFTQISGSKNGISGCKNEDNEYTMQARLCFDNSCPGADADFNISNYDEDGTLKAVVVRMLYGNEPHPLEIITYGDLPLPSQGHKIDSLGKAGVSRRRVEVNLLYADVPSPFIAAVASKGDISK